ncbi:MAG: DUF3574 domain-containing protein [Pseudomonadota bacterium]
MRQTLAAAALLFAAPAAALAQCAEGAMAWDRSELYFGLSRAGAEISPEEFTGFLDAEVTPRFPDGMTVVTAQGRWRSPEGRMVQENSMMVILLHPPETGAEARIEDIREAYKAQFDQQSVMLVSGSDCVSF